jgi:hemolysin D
MGSKLQYLQEQHDLVSSEQELLVQKSRHAEALAAVAAITETRAQIEAEFRSRMSDELSKAEQKAAALTQDLVKTVQRAKERTLTAPIDGVVQQLAVHTIGGVVTPAQPLLVLVPLASKLEIEAMISHQDIGFVEVGQPAYIKVRTFDFTKYGLINGKVESISMDAVKPDPSQESAGTKSPDASRIGGDTAGKEAVYVGRISLDREQIQAGDKVISLAPGMAVTVEIMTGSHRIISYLLSPLLRYGQESLRER